MEVPHGHIQFCCMLPSHCIMRYCAPHTYAVYLLRHCFPLLHPCWHCVPHSQLVHINEVPLYWLYQRLRTHVGPFCWDTACFYMFPIAMSYTLWKLLLCSPAWLAICVCCLWTAIAMDMLRAGHAMGALYGLGICYGHAMGGCVPWAYAMGMLWGYRNNCLLLMAVLIARWGLGVR